MSEQGSGAWLNQRVGKLTASRMADAMDFTGKGKESAKRKALKIEVLAERLTGDAVPHFVSEFMKWGIEVEPEAKQAFELRTGKILTPCGFVPHPQIPDFGASPDSLLGSEFVFEAKCPQTTTHIAWMLAGGVPEQHKPQILAQLACTRRTAAYFCSYDPRLPERQRLYIVEWEPKREEIEAVEEAARVFLAEVEAMFDQLQATEAV